MYGYQGIASCFGWAWMFPIIMIAMIVVCFIMMKGRMCSMIYWRGSHGRNSHVTHKDQE